MTKELFIAAHEALVDEYLETHPSADWQTAYDRTASEAHDRMVDMMADAADSYLDRMKECGE